LKKYNNELHILAKQLLEKEVLLKSDVEKLIGPRPYSDPSEIDLEAEEGNSNTIAESISDDSDPSSVVEKNNDTTLSDDLDEEPTDL